MGTLFSVDGTTGNLTTAGSITSTSTTSGFQLPSMTTTQRNAIVSPATGLEIFNTTTNQSEFYNGSAWVAVGTGSGITTLTGDVIASGTGSVAATLATVNSSPGSTTISSVTTNAKGLVTANSSASTTGTGSVVLANTPTLITPNLGTPNSGNLGNCTGVSLTSGVSGILPVANGGTNTATPSLVAGTNVTITGSWPNQTVNSTGGSQVLPQVLTSRITSDPGNAGNTYITPTGASISATLQKSTNKWKITVYSGWVQGDGSGGNIEGTVFRDATNIAHSSGNLVYFDQNWQGPATVVFVDAPGDTSAHTYTFQYRDEGGDGTDPAYFVNSVIIDNIFIMEEILS